MQSSSERATTTIPVTERIAGAPISWGVCEVPGWGHQLAPDRVLGEMRALGLRATEFGPVGFLDEDPAARAAQLDGYGLRAVGGFLPVLLHDPSHDPLPEVDDFIDGCVAAGAGVVVLAAFSGADGYDARPVLDDLGWKTMLANLDRLTELAAGRGVIAALHPHVGTMVENGDDVERVLAGSEVGLCIDTGHLAVAGADPVAITVAHARRVTHVHLKDVDAAIARRVLDGELAFGAAVQAGIFCPLGQGDLDIEALVRALEASGYQGWYVLEQDVMLGAEPPGGGPSADVRACLDFLLGAVA
jgi:inosose dehydratase